LRSPHQNPLASIRHLKTSRIERERQQERAARLKRRLTGDDQGRAYAVAPCPRPELLVLHYVPVAA
jgi:hypothetical protein